MNPVDELIENRRAIFIAMTFTEANVTVTGVQRRDDLWCLDTGLGRFEVPRNVVQQSRNISELAGRILLERRYWVKPAPLRRLRRNTAKAR